MAARILNYNMFAATPISSTNKTDCHDITEILLKISDKIEQECILKVYHVFILYHIVVINIFKISIWRLESFITTCLLI
jgi:hypothetical protein